MEIPTFGIKVADKSYQIRHAAYTIIADETKEKLVLVQAPNQAYFLPGGEIEEGESKEEAIHREALEELGFVIELGQYFGQSDDYFYSRHRETYFHNPAYFFETTHWKVKCQPLEKTNVIQWMPIEEALVKLKRGSHKWAVEQWQKQVRNKLSH